MWLFSKAGFFSVVQSSEPQPEIGVGTDVLSVRSRIEGDLERLRKMYVPELGPTVMLPGRDYPYRAYVHRDQLGAGLLRMVLDLDYGNFKSMVGHVFGYARAHLYGEVWSVMFGAEKAVLADEKKARKQKSI